MGICRLFGSGPLEAQSTVLALTYPHCCTSRFRARPFRHIGAAPSTSWSPMRSLDGNALC
jgi:hypothetical protein